MIRLGYQWYKLLMTQTTKFSHITTEMLLLGFEYVAFALLVLVVINNKKRCWFTQISRNLVSDG